MREVVDARARGYTDEDFGIRLVEIVNRKRWYRPPIGCLFTEVFFSPAAIVRCGRPYRYLPEDAGAETGVPACARNL